MHTKGASFLTYKQQVLRTVDRLLGAIQATFPGLYVLPAGSAIIRTEHIEELIDSERAHVDLLRKMEVKHSICAFHIHMIILNNVSFPLRNLQQFSVKRINPMA